MASDKTKLPEHITLKQANSVLIYLDERKDADITLSGNRGKDKVEIAITPDVRILPQSSELGVRVDVEAVTGPKARNTGPFTVEASKFKIERAPEAPKGKLGILISHTKGSPFTLEHAEHIKNAWDIPKIHTVDVPAAPKRPVRRIAK